MDKIKFMISNAKSKHMGFYLELIRDYQWQLFAQLYYGSESVDNNFRMFYRFANWKKEICQQYNLMLSHFCSFDMTPGDNRINALMLVNGTGSDRLSPDTLPEIQKLWIKPINTKYNYSKEYITDDAIYKTSIQVINDTRLVSSALLRDLNNPDNYYDVSDQDSLVHYRKDIKISCNTDTQILSHQDINSEVCP